MPKTTTLPVVTNTRNLAVPLANARIVQLLGKDTMSWTNTDAYVTQCREQYRADGLHHISFPYLRELMYKDFQVWSLEIRRRYKEVYRELLVFLMQRIESMDQEALIRVLSRRGLANTVTTLGTRAASTYRPISRARSRDVATPVVIHNILDNEQILKERMTNRQPFWFVDTGYTNFLIKHKTWHRLVQNHVHAHIDPTAAYPADRLRFLPSWPRPWNRQGNRILVVENSDNHYELFGQNLDSWRAGVEQDLKPWCERNPHWRVEYRVKNPDKKTRVPVYQYLSDVPKSWYCVITDCSAAAIEAIWLGVPVITLRRHVSHAVARTSIHDIEDLYRGPIGNWLCALTYNQFTWDEIQDGTAVKLLEKYGHA